MADVALRNLITMNTHILICSLMLATALAKANAQPVITKQPTNQSVSLGASAKFQISATVTAPPIHYQWQFRAAELVGATNSTLNLTNIQVLNAGDYEAVLTDASGSVTSRAAHLEVDSSFTKITTGSIVNDLGSFLAPAWGDYDNDGFIDLVVPSTRNSIDNTAQPITLYHNNGDGTFRRVANSAIGAEARDWRGCSWADYDNDGYIDLFAASGDGNGFPAENELFRNNGDGTFKKMEASEVGPIASNGGDASEGPAWADYDRDGFLDLFVSRHGPDWLFHNSGDGTFTKVNNASIGIPPDQADSYGAIWGDYDNDGWPDLFVPVFRGGVGNLLYHNRGNGTFEPVIAGSIAMDNKASSIGTWVDYDNDGDLDLLVQRAFGEVRALYQNNGDGTFTMMTSNALGPVLTDPATFGGQTWGDYDNDGFLDLFVANFNPVSGPNFLYHNNGDGSFSRVLSGSIANDAEAPTDNAAWGDYDNDGFLDLFVSRGGDTGPARNLLYRNNGNNNGWLKIKCVGTDSNRSAIGAKVRVKAVIGGKSFWQMREINSGAGFGQNPLESHFGLGNATNVDTLRIEWPSGIVQEFHDVPAKKLLTVFEPPRLLASVANGSPQFTLKGGRGFQYKIETSANLLTWSPLEVLTITNLSGTVSITDTNASSSGQRFYRAEQTSQ